MTRIKAHADDYNIVCEVLYNDNDRLHAFIAYGGCRYAEKGGLFLSSNAPRIPVPGTAYANIGGSSNITKWRHIVVNA